MSGNNSPWSSGSQAYDASGIIKGSIRSIASMKPFVDYNSLVEFVTAADIEIIASSKLQITETKLGTGAYMTVFRGSCIERFGDLPLAIKMIHIPLPRGSSEVPQFAADWMHQLAIISLELRVLSDKLLRCHPNIVKLLGISFIEIDDLANDSSADKFFKPILILEEAHRTFPTLEKFYAHLKAQGHEIPTDVKVALWGDIAAALSAVHAVGVVHGDIKPENILLFENPINGKLMAKLSDFGGCQPTDDLDAYDQYELLGTEYWNAPEAYDPGHPQHRSTFRDIYSFGLLGFYVLFELHPFGKPEAQTPRQREGMHNSKLNWMRLSHHIITKLMQQWPHVATPEALKHLRSLPQATDLESLKTRLASYRQYTGSGDVEIGIRAKPLSSDAQFGVRVSKHPDYRPFAMALALTLFTHAKPEKRDPYDILGNLSIFLNDEDIAMNLRDICGSSCWHYVLGLLDENELLPWQLTDISKYPSRGNKTRISWVIERERPAKLAGNLLGWDELFSVPESLRRILKGEYESRLDKAASSTERRDCLLALASLNIDSPDRLLAYYFEAAQLGSRFARAFCSKLGPENFEHCDNVRLQIFNRWAVEACMSSMTGIEVFLKRLEETCPSILESEEVLEELTESARDFNLLWDMDHDCSPWIPNPSQPLPEPALVALKAVARKDFPSLRETIAACKSVLDVRFANGDTLVHIAAEFDRTKMLMFLVNEYGMDVDSQNSEGMTPLATAAVHDCHDAMTTLLNLRAEYKRILSARVTTYLASVSRKSMITRLAGLRDVLEEEWGFLPNTTRSCPSLTEILDGDFSFFDDHMPESELQIAPIFASILGNNLSSLQDLLQHGCSQGVWAKFAAPSEFHLAPIHLACQLRPLHLGVLLHHGANVNLETDDEFRQTPLHLACTAIRRPCYNYPCSRLDPETADMSLPMLEETRLCMLRLLVSYGLTNFNAQDGLGRTALHHCARLQGCLPVMRALIQDFQADLGIQDFQLMTPLHHVTAMAGQDLAYLELCLSKLSNDAIDTPDVQGLTPLMWCVAAQRGENSIDLCECLITRGCSLALQSRYGATILHLAASEPGDDKLFAYLYDKVVGLDLLPALSDLVNVHGRTFAHGMARSKNPKIRDHLQHLPSKILREVVNKANLAGFTPLHEAALAGDVELVKFLMENGANAHQQDVHDLSPLCVAHAAGHSAVVELLQHGTELSPEDKEAWAWTLNKLKEDEEVREQKVLAEIAAETEGRKQLFKAARPVGGVTEGSEPGAES